MSKRGRKPGPPLIQNLKKNLRHSSSRLKGLSILRAPGSATVLGMSIVSTKSIEQITAEQLGQGDGSLKRVLGPLHLTTLGGGAIIRTRIFVLTGQAAAANAGPAIVLS